MFLGHDKVVNVLLQNQANVDAVNKHGDSALHFAAASGILKWSNSNEFNFFWTQLYILLFAGYDDVMNQLIIRRANINLKNNGGNTALHFAVRAGSHQSLKYINICKWNQSIIIFPDKENSVEFLLKNYAKSNIQNNDKKTPRDIATEKGLKSFTL